MKRRAFITFLGGASIAWRSAARAQQSERMPRIGVLANAGPNDPESQARIASLRQGLQDTGWTVGRNVLLDTRWSGGDVARLRQEAADLVAVGSDVIVAGVGPTLPVLQQATRTVPVVMAQGLDPVGAGFVQSLAQPGGNITGFTQFEYSLSGKWLELLKEVAPPVVRVAVLREPGVAGIGQWAIIQAVAQSLGLELKPIELNAPEQIERAIATFARSPNGGLIIVVSAAALHHRELIISLAARHRLPAVYAYRIFVTDGGLISYGADIAGQYRRAAGYVDRILRGEKPGDLPVQGPTKYDLVVNLKTAKALGLDVPDSLLARADEVIE